MASEAPILEFKGPNAFLSNFYVHRFWMANFQWMSSEHAFQAFKTQSSIYFLKIKDAKSPREAKRLGRLAPKRPDWEDGVRDRVMLQVLQHKFADPALCHRLLATGNKLLVEGNSWGDTYWGICNSRGENKLGKLLMSVRQEIMAEQSGRSHG